MISARASLCLILLLWLAPGQAEKADPQALKALQQTIRQLEQQRRQARAHLDESQRQLAELEARISRQNRQLRQSRKQQQALQKEIDDLRAQLRQLENEQQDLLRRLALQWRSAYGRQQLSRLRTLLQSRDPNAFFRWQAQQRYLDRQQLQWLQRLQQSQQEKQPLLEQLEERARALQENLEQLQQQARALKQSRRQWQARQQQQQQRLQQTRRALADARARRQRLQQLLRELDRSLKALDTQLPQPFARLKGRLPWPVKGRIRHAFGSPRADGLKWRGLEITASGNVEVRAMAHGRVVYADWLRGYGLLLILDHGDGYLSLYGNQAALYREVGEWVSAGEKLGRLDENGRLYLELRHRAKPVDPRQWLQPQ